MSAAAALVTGGGSGLGLATTAALAARGLRVVAADLPGAERERAVAAIDGADFVPADVTDEAALGAAVDAAAGLGPLRVLVACAGIAPAARVLGRDGPHDGATFERAVAVNLVGTFTAVRLVAAAMAATEPGPGGERGAIVLTASVAAEDGQIGQAAYAASKGGVRSLTLPLARDLAEHGIRVVTIEPGVFATPLLAGLPERVRSSLAAQVPFPARLGEPEEFAGLVGAILDTPYLNGETIRLDGGIRMGPR